MYASHGHDVLYDEVMKAMKWEISILKRVRQHPHIVQILGADDDAGVVIMEKGETDLKNFLQSNEVFSLDICRLWMSHMLLAVDFMHSIGIVHQDMKTANILLFTHSPNQDLTKWSAKVCDFGLSRLHAPDMTTDREMITLWYRPPELLMGCFFYTEKVYMFPKLFCSQSLPPE